MRNFPHSTVGPARAGRFAFTLIELMVVTAILGLVVGVLAACVTAGIRAWDTARTVAIVEGEALLGLRRVEKDLMNAFRFDPVGFGGQSRAMSFPALIRSERSDVPPREDIPAGGAVREGSLVDRRIGAVTYRFDAAAHALRRSQAEYGIMAPALSAGESVISNLQDLRFEYFRLAAGTTGGSGQWQADWTARTNLPDCVRIALIFKQGPAPVILFRTVVLPMGAGMPEGPP